MREAPDVAADAARAVEDWLSAAPDLAVQRPRPGAWLTALAGERKRSIPVYLELGGHTLAVESFFLAAPDEREVEVYRLLLDRHLRTYTCRFARAPTGDLLLVAVIPRHAVTVAELDRTLGQLLVTADETYWPAIRLGFHTYIEREQAWRASVGLGRNPIT